MKTTNEKRIQRYEKLIATMNRSLKLLEASCAKSDCVSHQNIVEETCNQIRRNIANTEYQIKHEQLMATRAVY